MPRGSFVSQIRGFRGTVDKRAQAVIDIATAETQRRIEDRTPVDTGKAKANWERVRVNQYTNDIRNGVDYILALEFGSSQQAPNGMVRITAEEWSSIIRSAAQLARRRVK